MTGKPLVLIISPANAKANNGNWQTALRWAGLLGERAEVQILESWQGEPDADLMIALHARKSAASMLAWSQRHPRRPLVLVLTGTDLYRDIHIDAAARRSLELASHMVVLQETGLDYVPPQLRERTRVIYQSLRGAVPAAVPAAQGPFTAVMVGHLREEKMPATFMQAAALLDGDSFRLLHVGDALDPALGEMARRTARAWPHYQWLGHLTHEQALAAMAGSHCLAHCSAMEGGANVIIEALACGLPVLASDIPGNRGMLGRDYDGYFPPGDAHALAALLQRLRAQPSFLAHLRQQCRKRTPLFSPQRERAALLELLDNVLPAD